MGPPPVTGAPSEAGSYLVEGQFSKKLLFTVPFFGLNTQLEIQFVAKFSDRDDDIRPCSSTSDLASKRMNMNI